jgi:ring-1,2-phenylacetyl-CoA epoxidase subunit PaaD
MIAFSIMATRDDIFNVLRTIPDPEMPISIVDLGLIEDVRAENGSVEVVMLPTFIGCPALDMIADDVKAKVGAIDGIARVDVRWIFDPPWSVDRITPAGRESLRAHGVTVPERGSKLPVAGHILGPGGDTLLKLSTSAVPCPYCGSRSTTLESSFGPTRCRTIYYCEKCRNSFEHLKRV